MKIALVGLPMAGKTTVFRLLFGEGVSDESRSYGLPEDHGRILVIEDPRLTHLAQVYESKKTTPIAFELMDTPAIDPKSEKERNRLFRMIQGCDLLVWIIGVFEEMMVSPMEQMDQIKSEIILRDLEILENRIDRLESSKRKLDRMEEQEIPILYRMKEALEQSSFPKSVYEPLDLEEKKRLGSYSLASILPQFVILNMDEPAYETNQDLVKQIQPFIQQNALDVLAVCGKLEMEINSLEEEERSGFMHELGVAEPFIQRFAAKVMKHGNRISFFTSGREESRAWILEHGSTALQAAGEVHSDMERGFIRAEIIKYDDFKASGSEKSLKEKGLIKVVGKEHPIEDGDILHIRFNV